MSKKINENMSEENLRENIDSYEFSHGKKHDQSDIDAIKNRAKNQTDFSTSFSKRKETDDGEESRIQDSDLEKEGLDKKKEELDKQQQNANKQSQKQAQKQAIGNKILNSLIDSKGLSPAALKAKILKLKITLIVIGVLAAIFAFVILVAYLSYAWDAWTNAISSFFGISEVDTEENMSVEEADGLFDNEDYQYDENGNQYSMEELVLKLKDDKACVQPTLWNSLADAFSSLNDPCIFLRFLNKTIDEIEENDGITLDRVLVISTIFYGYTAQPYYDDYDNPESAGERIPSVNHYESLVDVLKNGKIKRKDIKKIIDYSIADTSFTYYTWEIDESTSGKKTGKCTGHEVKDKRYSLTKWKIFMRYGEEVANTWENDIKKIKQIQSSDEQCNGTMTKSQLQEMVDSLDSDVTTILNGIPENSSSMKESVFEQAADIESNQKDIFQSYTNLKGETIEFDYKNGYVYQNFPAFKQAIEDSSINIEYDDVVTPKEIETIIQNIISKKYTLNEILLYEDQDKPDRYLGSYNGYSSVVLGAYCGDLLTAPLDQINVYINDCDGKYITTTNMKDYITGVVYAEIDTTIEEYAKTQMLVAQTYALQRRNNYTVGTQIIMRSGNCDQAYCPLSQGCHEKSSSLSCGNFNCTSYVPGPGWKNVASQSRIDQYSTWYDELSDMLIIDKKTGKLANASYLDTRQKEWEQNAKKGMNFTQIIVDSYAKDGKDYEIIRCSEKTDSTTNETTTSDKYGNQKTEKYPLQAPDKGKFYGYSYNDEPEGQDITINPEWVENNIISVNSNCADEGWNKYYKVNKQASDNYKKAFSNICKILKEGVKISSGETCKYTVDDLQGGETYAARKTINEQISDISYGITQTWNYNKEIKVGNTTYKPYSSERDLVKYNSFISALGKEEHCQNVNYILYKYAYKDAGFEWGGNWGRNGNDGTFNGMYFYVKY